VLILFGASLLHHNSYNNPAQHIIQEVQKHTGIPAPQIQNTKTPPDTYPPDDSNNFDPNSIPWYNGHDEPYEYNENQ